jgi:AcrR family transcriptional regulator
METRPESSTADAIRRSALECFARDGYHASSLREISRMSGVTLGTIYHYYPSKEGLLLDLMLEAMRPLLASIQEVKANVDDSPPAQLFWATKRFAEFAATNQHLAILADVELRALSKVNYDTVIAVRDAYEREIRMGTFAPDDPKIAVFAILAIANQAAHWYRPDGGMSVEEVSMRLARVAMRIVGGDVAHLGTS